MSWLKAKDPSKEFVFYGMGRSSLTYAGARVRFVKYIERAGLSAKGYTIHCLRHTFASELLNAGMRLECLQHLLGHTSLEVTRRYARLTDKTREEEYFRAMTIIEKGVGVAIIDSIINFRRHLKRKNYSQRTVRDYMSTLKQFIVWLDCPIEEATNKKVLGFMDFLLDKKLQPKTINCYLDSIRSFYEYLKDGEDLEIANPVKRGYCLRLSKPLPRFLKDEEVSRFLQKLEGLRDRAMFLLMLRCGLGVEEVASLTVGALDLRRGKLLVKSGKGAKDRMVYVSPDAHEALTG